MSDTNLDSIEKFIVNETHIGKRVDVVLSDILEKQTRSQIKRLISEKQILVDGKPIKPSRKLELGEEVVVKIPKPEPNLMKAEDIPLVILYEDPDIAVVDKPAGISMHPGAGIKSGTVVNALLHMCSDLSGIGGTIRPGIVHRLDKDTSGVVVIAKNDTSHLSLAKQFKDRTTNKTYTALVEGVFKSSSGTYDLPIGRHPTQRKQMSTKSKSGKEAHTAWRIVEQYLHASLVEITPKTGRTHQIRVHFADAGHPIIGDKTYRQKKEKTPIILKVSKELGRQALHASKLGFIHPSSGKYVEFESELPDDIKSAIRQLKTQNNYE